MEMENTMELNELNEEAMEQVSGGSNKGGYEHRPREKAGCFIYKVQSGDTLIRIASRYGTTVNRIMRVNPELSNPNYIVAGHYIYIPY